jgi:hypothetical protein
MITFQRQRVRGGIVRIEIDGRFAGEIATCKWGYGLRLPGVYWHPESGEPSRSGFTQKGFSRQKDAVAFVKTLPRDVILTAAEFAAEHNMVMA